MNTFVTTLNLDAYSAAQLMARKADHQLYLLTTPLGYQSDVFGLITAPEGLETDFASIPRAIWNIIDPEDPIILYPSVIHDYLYTIQGQLPNRVALSRQQCDTVLREAMIACGASAFKAWAVYHAVEMFGAAHWEPKTI